MNVRPSHDAVAARLGRGPRFAGMLRAGVVAVLVMAAVGVAGCAPGPDPKPTPTPLFTSEADAFKAAEQVYRNYVDAGNALQNGDQQADPEQYLAGTALEDDLNTRRELAKNGLAIAGNQALRTFTGTAYTSADAQVLATACIDVGATRVLNRSGVDVTPTGRASVVPLALQFNRSGDKLLVTKSSSGSHQCDP